MSQPKTQFKTENDEARSNLRDKGKTFNFGMAADYSGSEEEPEDAGHTNFDKPEVVEEDKNDSDEEMQIHLQKRRQNERINPFGHRIGKQELQPSQMRKNQQAALQLQQKIKKSKGKGPPQLRLDDGEDDPAGTEETTMTRIAKPPPALALEEEDPEEVYLPTIAADKNEGAPSLHSEMEIDLENPGAKTDNRQKGSKHFKSHPGTNRNSKQKANQAMSKNLNKIRLDIEAINELYDYGGEQGSKKQSMQDELMDFETGILELANQCLAAMKRERPTDPIIYDNDHVKKSFEEKFNIGGDDDDQSDRSSDANDRTKANESGNEQPNYFRPNFNVPTTMRGIKNLALSIGFRNDKPLGTQAESQQIEESQFEDYDDESPVEKETPQ